MAAVLGRNEETQAEFRLRYRRYVGRNSRSTLHALESKLLELDGVRDALVRDNDDDNPVVLQGVTIGANSIYSVVDGGSDDDVAQTVYRYKPGGIPTAGDETVQVQQFDSQGVAVGTIGVHFARAVLSPITISFTLTPGPQYPADGTERIIAGLVEYMSEQGISDPLDGTRLLAPILAVLSHQITGLTAVRKTSGAGRPRNGRRAPITLPESGRSRTCGAAWAGPSIRP